MDEILKKIIESFEANMKITDQLVSDLKKTLGEIGTRAEDKPAKRRAKDKPETPAAAPAASAPAVQEPAKVPDAAEPKPHSEGGALLVKDVTIEMIRERSTVFSDSKNFGMDSWLALAQKVTGQKKVKDIPKEMYGAFYAAMGDELEKRAKDNATLTKPALVAVPDAPKSAPAPVEKPAVVGGNGVTITIEQLKEKAKAFMDANGQPALIALVKAFGATKISEIAPAKYPAFLEAISNA